MSLPPPPNYNQAANYGYDNDGDGNVVPPTGPKLAFAPASYPPPQGNKNAVCDQPSYDGNESELTVPKANDDVGEFSVSFSDDAIRRGFIRKVYLILFSQLLFTLGIICLFIFVEPIKYWVQNDGLWFYGVAIGTFLVLYIVLICCPKVRKNYPGNFICLILFTLAFSYLAATISSFHDTSIVLMAAGITAAVCLAISIFAIQTKIDFTLCNGFLFVLVMVLFFFGWTCLLTYYTWGSNRILSCVYGALAALVFGLFLIYDTQQVIGGRRHELSPEEYVYGALQLYMDVVFIFLIILGFMGKS